MLAEEILMVNDGSLLLKMMGGLLESRGYHISLTDSPEEALVLLSTRHIVLVVMKMNGQETDRLAVAHMVRELNDGTKMVFMGESTHLPAEIFEIEADDYILLPCRGAEIWRRLLNSLKSVPSRPVRSPELRLVNTAPPPPVSGWRQIFPNLHGLYQFVSKDLRKSPRRKKGNQRTKWRPFAKSPSKAG